MEIFFKMLLVMVVVSFPFMGMYSLILFIVLIIIRMILPNNETRFLKNRKNMPITQIGSMATGSVKLHGKLNAQKWMKSPLSKRNCIGYYLTIHEVERDSDGEKHFRLTHEESGCEPFIFQDMTGKVQVDGETLKLYLLPVAKEQHSPNEIVREYLLQPGGDYILIGRAVRKNGERVIIRDPYRQVFGVAPFYYLERRDRVNDLIRVFMFYFVIIILLVFFSLALPVEIKEGCLYLIYSHWF